MNNNKLGHNFEKDFAKYLSDRGFWVHFMEGSAHTGSQPFDIIALKYDRAYCFDCKTLANKTGNFPLSRIETNQILSYKKIRSCENISTFFGLAILWEDKLYLVDFENIDFNNKSFNLKGRFVTQYDFYEEANNENKS